MRRSISTITGRFIRLTIRDGSKVGTREVSIDTIGDDNRGLALRGLPTGYVLTPGDLMSWDYGANPSRRALHRVVERAVASSGGTTPVFQVTPPLRTGVAEGLGVELRKPAAKMRITSFDAGFTGPIVTTGLAFAAIEVRS